MANGTSLTLKLIAASGAIVALTACEGEPPKVPVTPGPSATQSAEPAPVESAAAAPPQAEAPQTAAAAPGPCPCSCPCASGTTQGNPQAQSGPAAAQEHPASTTPSAPSAAHANIVGTVTTMPARAASAAVVYLEDAPIVPNLGSSAGVDNRGMSFIPFVSVVTVGARVVFTNADPFPHNVFSPDNERFNIGQMPQHGSRVRVFKSPGVYSLLCNLHPNMIAYIVVSPSSYFAKANASGQYKIKDVPTGSYKITAWAPRLQTVTESITVKDTDVTASFSLHR